MAISQEFRICPKTGLKVHRPAETLIKANAVLAVVMLLVGGLFALMVALTRWPAVHLLPSHLYYRFLTLHGIDALLAWIIFFEIAGLYFGSAVLLNSRLAAPKVGWLALILMLAGGGLINVIVLFTGTSDVMFTSYIPLKAHPLYYLGVILFAVGALVGVCLFFATLMIAKSEGTYKGSVPLVTFGLIAAAIIAVVTLAHGAIIMIPTFLWSVGLIQHMDPATYKLVFWGLGHPSQQINVTAMIAVWYLLATLTTGAQPINEKLCRTAFVLYILFINVASEHHLLTDPVFSPVHKILNTGYFMHMGVLASMIHAFAVPASVEVALRKKGYTKGLFEWLKKAPWDDPGFSSLIFSILLFGFIGGISGVVFGTEQINIIRHNTLSIPGHFHGTVVGGTTMAFMGLTYYVLPLIFRREVVAPGLARVQPYIYAIGVFLLAIGMLIAGTYGVPRRHWDITFAGAPFPFSFDPTVFFALSILGIGALLAVVGGAIYILVTVGTVLFGKRL